MARMNFGGMWEEVVTRDEFPLSKARRVLKDEVVTVLGYGVQGPAQALNMRDNGIRVIIGQRPEEKFYWNKALADGWKPGKTLFPLEGAVDRGTIIQFLISDAGQMAQWPNVKPHLKAGDALYFSHGFSIVYHDQTRVIPPKDIDVIMVDSDGNIDQLLPLGLEGGVNGFWPLECAAGMDAVALRQKYGNNATLAGNMDKRALLKDKTAIRQEVTSKLPYLLKTGGFFPSIDHLVPPDTPWENYVYFINTLREVAGLEKLSL